MSKKDFKAGFGLDALVNNPAAQPEKGKVGRPKTSTREITKTSQEGTKENETRATFIVNEEKLDKIKVIAFWNRKEIKEVVDAAFTQYIERYESENGTLQMRK